MSQPLPINNQFVQQQTYLAGSYKGNPATYYNLAAPTGGYVYKVGSLMARYTSGPNSGQVVNYVAAGTNGQNVCVGVLMDQQLSYAQMTAGGGNAYIQFGGVHNQQGPLSDMYDDTFLSTLTSGDVATGMTALGARLQTTAFNNANVWYWP